MASWNSVPLEITYQVLGWTAFLSWAMCFYPQVISNFCRKSYYYNTNKFPIFFLGLDFVSRYAWLLIMFLGFLCWGVCEPSVVGMSFDFVVLNLTKHSFYLIYNASLFFSPTIQKQYYEKYGYGEMIPVAANDVALSTHTVLMTALLLFQILVYERGSQKVSKIAIAIVSAVCLFAAACFFVALPSHSWLWLISIFNSIQVFMTVIKYIPQAFMNFKRKSTDGFSIGYILLDVFGGLTSFLQMVVQSIDQGSLVNFYGNKGKVLLSLLAMSFDIIFMCQRFVLYPVEQPQVSLKLKEESKEPLVKLSDPPHSEHV